MIVTWSAHNRFCFAFPSTNPTWLPVRPPPELGLDTCSVAWWSRPEGHPNEVLSLSPKPRLGSSSHLRPSSHRRSSQPNCCTACCSSAGPGTDTAAEVCLRTDCRHTSAFLPLPLPPPPLVTLAPRSMISQLAPPDSVPAPVGSSPRCLAEAPFRAAESPSVMVRLFRKACRLARAKSFSSGAEVRPSAADGPATEAAPSILPLPNDRPRASAPLPQGVGRCSIGDAPSVLEGSLTQSSTGSR